MKDINESLLESIELINESVIESEVNVMNSMVDYYDKQSQIIEYCDDIDSLNELFFQEADDPSKEENKDDKKKDGKSSNILKKIWNAIKKFFGMIIKHIKKIINSFRNKASENNTGNAPVESVAAIASEILTSGASRNKPDNIDAWSFPKPNPKYLTGKATTDTDKKTEAEKPSKEEPVKESFYDEMEYDEYIMEDGEGSSNGGVKINIPADPKSEIKGGSVELKENDMTIGYINNGKTLKITIHGYGKVSKTHIKDNDGEPIKGQPKEWYQTPKLSLHIMTHDKSRDEITKMVNLAVKVMKERKPEDIKQLKKNKLNILEANGLKQILHMESNVYEVPITQLTATQTWASQLLENMEAFTSTNVSVDDIDKETISALNNLVTLLMRIQISLNFISTALNGNNMLLIDKSQYKSIKSLDLLDEFVGKCIHSGVPPKYVAYNAWLISDECIRGNGQYKPMFGHARATLFPPNDKIVLKIGLSGLGTVSNETEERVSQIYVNMDRVDLIAPVVKTFKTNSIIAMERVNGNFDLTKKELTDYADKACDALEEYQKKSGKSLGIKISRGSQHIGNVAYDKKYHTYRSIDYGIHYRSK